MKNHFNLNIIIVVHFFFFLSFFIWFSLLPTIWWWYLYLIHMNYVDYDIIAMWIGMSKNDVLEFWNLLTMKANISSDPLQDELTCKWSQRLHDSVYFLWCVFVCIRQYNSVEVRCIQVCRLRKLCYWLATITFVGKKEKWAIRETLTMKNTKVVWMNEWMSEWNDLKVDRR